MEIYKTIILAIIAYFIGSISFGYIITKRMTGKDIRNLRVKNAGAFNVFLNVGSLMGILVGLLDCFKTLLIVLVAQAWGLDTFHTVVAASFGIIGHCFPIYYNFYGGKGAGSVVGIFIYFIPIELLISIVPAALIAYIIHRLGTTPVFFILFSPLIAFLFNKPDPVVYAILYVTILTLILNLIIFISKRDRRVFTE
ncbi:MAG: glycerol-3-phosphate acyltransferase [Candidatus Cloacimonetes bacterium]|nr:glycerol-3-phosphate acyltransferase [Candidatus Cloacimonadota bacterium]